MIGASPVEAHGFAWERNWIDHRRSRANVYRRIGKGDVAPTCNECGAELDVTPVPHSPRCNA